MIKKTVLGVLVVIVLSLTSKAQGGSTHVNREYQEESGSPSFSPPILNQFGIQWSRSITKTNGDIITVGHSTVSGQGENIYLKKLDSGGNIIFAVDWGAAGTDNEYGINLYEASNGDIYVCGTTDNGGSTNYDGIILRYNSGGTLLNATTFAGPDGKNDIATALMIHPTTNNLIVAVCNENNATSYDYLVLELNPTSLAQFNTGKYDYSNLIEVVLGIEVDFVSGDIILVGGSQSSMLTSAYAVAVFDGSTLSFISDARTDLIGSPYDQPTAYVKDNNNNIFVTGKTLSGSTYNVKTVKILSNYSIAWTATLNVHGLDDIASTIVLDPVTGDVIIGGYATKTNNLKEMICVRYNGSNGTQISIHNQSSEDHSGDAVIKKVCTNSGGDVYFVGGEKGISGNKQVVVGKIKANSTSSWQRRITNVTQDIFPSDIIAEGGEVYVISVLDSLTDSYLTTKYKEFEPDTTRIYNSKGNPVWMKNELVVGFLPSAINKAAIDNLIGTKVMEFGYLGDFLTTGAATQVTNAFNELCRECDIKVTRIFENFKTTDTTSISRLGETIPLPEFWADLLLEFPSVITLQQAHGILKSLSNIVSYAHPNFISSPTSISPPNDTLYASQLSLSSPTAGINVEEAWDVVPNGGKPFVKCGIFDSGIQWGHPEFGYNGNYGSGKIKGWDFASNSDIWNTPMGDNSWHGTACAGIIGAIRNNSIGLAGIAGGDEINQNSGVSLYSLSTFYATLTELAKVIERTSRFGSDPKYGYGLHLSNNSWGYDSTQIPWSDTLYLLTEAVRNAVRHKVTFVVSRGNGGGDDRYFPAILDSNWVISVGGSGSNGQYTSTASYGSGMDVVAPAVNSMIWTTYPGGYTPFDGTSAAAPHVTGVAALLMSYLNDSTGANNYKNLAPEDCDFIIRKSATDIGPPGWDQYSSWGRLNAGKALRMVEKPYRLLYHYGTNALTNYTLSKSVYSNSDTVILTERYKNYAFPSIQFQAGKYVVKTFQVNATVNHNVTYASDSLMYFWPRHSSSYVYELPNAQKRLTLHERVKINSCTGSSASLTGYVYQVSDTLGNPLGWWPCDTSFSTIPFNSSTPKSLMEYSILTKNKAVGISENTTESRNILLYPNPAQHSQTLVIESEKESDCIVELYDLMGRFIKTIYKGKAAIGQTIIRHDVEKLPNSMYIYIIKMNGKILNKKFIKG